MTLREFLRRVEDQYGLRPQTFPDKVRESKGFFPIQYIERERGLRSFTVLLGVEPDDELHPNTLRSLCAQLGLLPQEDFGLDPEEPFDGFDDL